jgi:hypothetical protein
VRAAGGKTYGDAIVSCSPPVSRGQDVRVMAALPLTPAPGNVVGRALVGGMGGAGGAVAVDVAGGMAVGGGGGMGGSSKKDVKDEEVAL